MSENQGPALDLLGDPIPEGLGRRGRPQHLPTQQNRQKVVLLLAIGWPDGRIAQALAVTKPTLKRHYFRELRVREEARNRVDGALLTRCWEQVEKGNVGAMKEMAKMLERSDLMVAHPAASRDKQPAVPKLGKKESALLDAGRPNVDTTMGELIARRIGTTPLN